MEKKQEKKLKPCANCGDPVGEVIENKDFRAMHYNVETGNFAVNCTAKKGIRFLTDRNCWCTDPELPKSEEK